jgi:hypothetical protein
MDCCRAARGVRARCPIRNRRRLCALVQHGGPLHVRLRSGLSVESLACQRRGIVTHAAPHSCPHYQYCVRPRLQVCAPALDFEMAAFPPPAIVARTASGWPAAAAFRDLGVMRLCHGAFSLLPVWLPEATGFVSGNAGTRSGNGKPERFTCGGEQRLR